MAEWTGMVMTTKGRALLAKAEAGATLTFTKVKVGDGTLSAGQSLEDLTDLINTRMVLNIISKTAVAGICKVLTEITNVGLSTGFEVREMGLYATDPDDGEILYSVGQATVPDYLTPEGGATVISSQYEIDGVTGNASSIEVVITPTGNISRTEFTTIIGDTDDLTTTSKIIVGAINELKAADTAHLADYAHKAAKIYAYKNLGGGL